MTKYELKTKKNDGDVIEFINSIKDNQRRQDAIRLLEIFADETHEEPVMWGSSIIGYGTYHYKYASGQEGDWMCTGFSPRVQSMTLYIMSGFDDYAKTSGYDPEPLLAKLGAYTTGKACLYIKKLDDIDEKVLRKLIKSSYQHMRTVS